MVSLDATPIQYDELGDHYGHTTAATRRAAEVAAPIGSCFAGPTAVGDVVGVDEGGLVNDYDVPPEKVVVISPGVDYDRWAAEGQSHAGGRRATAGPDPVRRWRPRSEGRPIAARCDCAGCATSGGAAVELDLVTHDELPPEDGITVHHGLGPNSPALIELYREADVFCLPTLGDCLPMVLSEAGAAGLPLVSTDVGAIREIVRPEETGLLVPVERRRSRSRRRSGGW